MPAGSKGHYIDCQDPTESSAATAWAQERAWLFKGPHKKEKWNRNYHREKNHTHIIYIYIHTHDNKCTYIYIIWLFNIYIYIGLSPLTLTVTTIQTTKKKHKHDGPKMPLRSWIGTFCQSTNSQRSCGFHSMNPIVHKEVGFVYTLTGKGQWELRSVYWKIQGNPVQRLRLCTILSNQRRPTK